MIILNHNSKINAGVLTENLNEIYGKRIYLKKIFNRHIIVV